MERWGGHPPPSRMRKCHAALPWTQAARRAVKSGLPVVVFLKGSWVRQAGRHKTCLRRRCRPGAAPPGRHQVAECSGCPGTGPARRRGRRWRPRSHWQPTEAVTAVRVRPTADQQLPRTRSRPADPAGALTTGPARRRRTRRETRTQVRGTEHGGRHGDDESSVTVPVTGTLRP